MTNKKQQKLTLRARMERDGITYSEALRREGINGGSGGPSGPPDGPELVPAPQHLHNLPAHWWVARGKEIESMGTTRDAAALAWRRALKIRGELPAKEPTSTRPDDDIWRMVITGPKEAADLIERALAVQPRLTRHGVGLVGNEGALSESEREMLRDALLEVAVCADWLRGVSPLKSLNRKRDSYRLKQTVERQFAFDRARRQYVSNGALIAAALGLGFAAEFDGLNAYLPVSERDAERPGLAPRIFAHVHVVRPDGTQDVVSLRSHAEAGRIAQELLQGQPMETSSSALFTAGDRSPGGSMVGGIDAGSWEISSSGVGPQQPKVAQRPSWML
jgi:hypothetical protein